MCVVAPPKRPQADIPGEISAGMAYGFATYVMDRTGMGGDRFGSLKFCRYCLPKDFQLQIEIPKGGFPESFDDE